jgi:VCBS repeat protein
LAVGDIDGEGAVDVVTSGKDVKVAAWYQNDGKGTFKKHIIAHNQSGYDLRLIDMDGDGDLDVLNAGETSKNVVWYENKIFTSR